MAKLPMLSKGSVFFNRRNRAVFFVARFIYEDDIALIFSIRGHLIFATVTFIVHVAQNVET